VGGNDTSSGGKVIATSGFKISTQHSRYPWGWVFEGWYIGLISTGFVSQRTYSLQNNYQCIIYCLVAYLCFVIWILTRS
jgi:hypothetical protein